MLREFNLTMYYVYEYIKSEQLDVNTSYFFYEDKEGVIRHSNKDIGALNNETEIGYFYIGEQLPNDLEKFILFNFKFA